MSHGLSVHHLRTRQSFFSTPQHHPHLPTVALHSAAWASKSRAPIFLRSGHTKRTVKCMVNTRTVKMVAKQLMRELSDMLLTDKVVKVYVSVFGDDRGKEVAIAGLKSKAKYVRSELGRRMMLWLTPEIRFIENESLEKGSRVIAILDKIKAEKQAAKSENKEQFE